MGEPPKIKSLVWIGSSRKDLKSFPAEVKDVMGYAFQKKSKKGIATPKPDIDLIKRRLRIAEEDYKMRQAGKGRDK